MHATVVSSVVLFLLTSTSSTIAQSHDGLLKQNHHQFLRVKRGGATLHLIGDETVARWNGGSVANLPKPSVVALPATTSYTNLMDSINAGLGVPVGRPTASASSTSSSSLKPVLAISTTSSSSTSKKAASSSSSKASSSSSIASSPVSSVAKVALAAGRGAAKAQPTASAQPSKRHHVAFNATVAEDVDEDHVNALGRRATGNATAVLARGRGGAAASSSSTSSILPNESEIPVADTESAVAFSAADLTTSQGWGALFANKYTSMSVNNHAVKSASARSVYRDLWPSILGSIKSGDVVVFQLGHYDSTPAGSSQDTAEGCLGAVPGSDNGSTTITSGCTGAKEVVRTYFGYLSEMCKAVKGAGATCVIASVTPKSKWSGTSLFYNSPYTSQAKAAASAAGGIYVPHLETIGKQVAAQGFPVAQQYWLGNGALQPNTAGADAFASAFAAAVGCAGVGALTSGLTEAGKAVTGLC